MPNVIGISSYYHDSACCILKDGILAAAAQEERFSRRKHDRSLPKAAFRYCLDVGGLDIMDIDLVAYYESPQKKLDRQIWLGLPKLTTEYAIALWRRSKQPLREIREVLGYEGVIEQFTHHESHAAAAFFYSGFEEAAILTCDGVGEWGTTTYGRGEGKKITFFEEVAFPDSLGLLYSAITSYLGFSVNDGEYKVMGLAPYGKPIYVDKIRNLVKVLPKGQYRLDLKYFDFTSLDRMYSDELVELLGEPPRKSETVLSDFHKDLARSLQVVLEEILLEKSRYLYEATGSKKLCMAGGVALNCVANSRLLTEGPFNELFVQPAAGDAGSALGAAALGYTRLTGERLAVRKLEHAYLGPEFANDEIFELLHNTPTVFEDFRGREQALLEAVVDRLATGKVVGWFQGRMEFGPRALGARSILADPRDPGMRDRINVMVKKREEFRPFAPSVLADRAALHFNLDHPSPYMLETWQVISHINLPAITHVDGSARIQTVDEAANPRFARLLKAFESRTGCPILLNTSFNIRDEPIVCSPVSAIICFIRAQIDTLVLEDFVIDRSGLSEAWPELFKNFGRWWGGDITQLVYTLI